MPGEQEPASEHGSMTQPECVGFPGTPAWLVTQAWPLGSCPQPSLGLSHTQDEHEWVFLFPKLYFQKRVESEVAPGLDLGFCSWDLHPNSPESA